MRVRSLGLERYGAFTSREVEFGPGLTLVVGANEAGKSTTLEALSDLLWGFRRGLQSFEFGPASLSLTARLDLPAAAAGASEASEASEVEVRRRNTGLYTLGSGTPFEALWGAGGTEAHRRWHEAFGLTHAALRRGGASVFSGSGDLAELVFTARSGRAVRGLLEALETEMDALYKPHRNNKSVQVRLALADSVRLSEQAASSMTKAGAVTEADGEHERRRREAEVRTARLRTVSRHHNHLEQWLKAAPYIRELVGLRAEHSGLLAAGAVLCAEQIARFESSQASLEAAEADLERLTAARDATAAERAALTVDAAILADEEVIARLHRVAEARHEDDRRAQELDGECRRLYDAARISLTRLVGPADDRPTETLVADLHVPADLATQLDELAAAIGRAEQELARAELAVEAARARQAASTQQVPEPDPAAVEQVADVVTAIRAEGSAAALTRDAIDSAARLTAQRRDALRRAGARNVDACPPPVPPRAAVRQARDRFDQADTDLGRAEDECADAERALETARDLLAAAEDTYLPDQDTLADLRAERADLWSRLVRDAGTGLDPALADQLLPLVDAAVRRVDDIADQLISHADLAARRAQLRRDADDAEVRHEAALDARSAALAEVARVSQEWESLWDELGLASPGPADADDVRRALDDAQQAQTDLLAAQQRMEGLADQVAAQRTALARALDEVGRARPEADLDTLLVAADKVLGDDDAAREARTAAQLQAHGTKDAERARDDRACDLRGLEQRWVDLVRDAGLAPALRPVGWAERSEVLAEAADSHGRAAQAQRDVAQARQRFDAFVTEVADLASRHGEAVRLSSPGEALARLADRLASSLDARSRAEVMDRDAARDTALIAEATQRRDAAIAGLDELGEEVGLPEDHVLIDAVVLSRNAIALAERARTVESLIRAAAPVDELETLVKELAERDDDSLRAELDAARDEREDCVAANDDAQRALGEIQLQLRRMREAASAGELHARAQESLALVAEHAERYLVVRIQYEILRSELEAYERRYASPLLADAGRILEGLTEGRYVALRAIDRGEGRRSLLVVRSDERELGSGELSEGTADQVYLALRLAAINQMQGERVGRGEPALPVALDDVLMTFDDARAGAALRVLAELARNWQVIVFTHHEHLAEIVRSVSSAAQSTGRSEGRAAEVQISRLPGANVLLSTRDAEQIRASTSAVVRTVEHDSSSIPTAPHAAAPHAAAPHAAVTGPSPRRASRVASMPSPSLPAQPQPQPDYDPGAVRTWARAHGYDVGERGRIAADILIAYQLSQQV